MRKSDKSLSAKKIKIIIEGSCANISATEAGGDVIIFVENQEIKTIRHAACLAGVDEVEFELALFRKGLPAYRFESAMLADYASDYWLAAEMIASAKPFSPPFLFCLGHAFELAIKGFLVFSQRTRVSELKAKFGHDLVKLWDVAIHSLSGISLHSKQRHIIDYSKIYHEKLGDSNFFVRYPDRSHLWQKWPDSIAESVNAIGNDAWSIIRKLNSDFKGNGWQYKECPDKSVKWTP